MTQDEIIEMARQAASHGVETHPSGEVSYVFYNEHLMSFAKLVAAKEREACAKVCEELRDDWLRGLGRYEFMGEGADYCADEIRARGQE